MSDTPIDNAPVDADSVDVSIVVPAYNAQAFLGTFFDCLLSQTYTNFRVVFVDDGSSDGTRAVAEQLGRQLSGRFVLLPCDVHRGLSSARNEGLDWVAGHPTDFVTFLDVDDTFEEGYLEDLHTAALSCDADLAIAGIVRIQESTGRRLATEMVKCPRSVVADSSTCDHLAYINPCAYAKLFRFSRVKDLRFRSIMRSEDTCYLFEALPACRRVAFTNRAYYRYCARAGSLTSHVRDEERASMHDHFAALLPLFDAGEHAPYREMFESQVFVHSSIGGVLRRLDSGGGNAAQLGNEEIAWLDSVMSNWRRNRYLSFGGGKSATFAQWALKCAASLYKMGHPAVFINAYRFLARVLKREVRA